MFQTIRDVETLRGQAYVAEQYHKLGLQTYTAIFCLFICLICVYMGKLLTLLGPDPLISQEAGRF